MIEEKINDWHKSQVESFLERLEDNDTGAFRLYHYFQSKLDQWPNLSQAEKRETATKVNRVSLIQLEEKRLASQYHIAKSSLNILKLKIGPPVHRGGALMSAFGWGWTNPKYDPKKLSAKRKEMLEAQLKWESYKRSMPGLFKEALGA
jgi:hypothetical protein